MTLYMEAHSQFHTKVAIFSPSSWDKDRVELSWLFMLMQILVYAMQVTLTSTPRIRRSNRMQCNNTDKKARKFHILHGTQNQKEKDLNLLVLEVKWMLIIGRTPGSKSTEVSVAWTIWEANRIGGSENFGGSRRGTVVAGENGCHLNSKLRNLRKGK